MAQEINLGGTIYVSSKRAAEMMGYSQDYVGQLARSGAIEAKRVSGLWYVLEDSIRKHKEKADEYVPQPPPYINPNHDSEVAVSFDGKDYISAGRAAKLTGYTQDYVGQLARSSQILSRQIGNRWYVDRESLLKHKDEKDSLLAAVQSESVGLAIPQSPNDSKDNNDISDSRDTHFNYISAENILIPTVEEKDIVVEEVEYVQSRAQDDVEEPFEEVQEEINPIPIRVIASDASEFVDEEPQIRPYGIKKAKKSSKMMIFSVSLLTVAAMIGTIGYAASALGYLKLPHSLNTSQLTANISSAGIVTDIREAILPLISRDIVYKRSKNNF